ncbi:MAG: ABC transporter ATP-binding protein [Rhizobiales bacterium]|nr:ABC transporter ATP-binding protein [Hyphomicrobiales bacterium]
MNNTILFAKNINKVFGKGKDTVQALSDVTFGLQQGECLAIVGESGSGKSTIANVILGIFPPTSGEITFLNEKLLPERSLMLKKQIQFVQQNPLSALNPKKTIGASIKLALDVHNIGDKSDRGQIIDTLLLEVGLPIEFKHRLPAALSGGQRQRVSIARALACEPKIIVLDEPTSALDVLVQARILNLLNKLRKERGISYIFITHDLAVVRNIANNVCVFNQGKIVEYATTDVIFNNPKQQYTRQLISAIPVIDKSEQILRNKLSEAHNAQF